MCCWMAKLPKQVPCILFAKCTRLTWYSRSKALLFDFPNDFNSKILLQKMVAGYRQSCMAILMDYVSQCDRVFCGDSKRKINVKYFLIPAYNKYLSQVCRSASLQSAFVAHRTGTSKTKKIQIYLDEVALFWMSQWAACPPACTRAIANC